ncbi:hypothetical protein F4604DRAFT_1768020 [Suillus subluteus]|nr:hypothetical protein F4604DRAFT_1768020 [Suillus subluteus]
MYCYLLLSTFLTKHDGNQAPAEHTEEPFKEWFKSHYSEQPEDYTWTQTHSFFALMGGFMLYVDGKPYRTLSPDQLLDLIRNAISKGLIIIQGAWFILQLLSRAIYHLDITHIEVATLAFAVLNFLSYAMWWNKPLDVQCPHPVYWKSAESNPEISFPRISEDDDLPISSEMVAVSLVDSLLQIIGVDAMSPLKLRVPTFDSLHGIKLQPWESNVITFVALTVATIFGGIHCSAWFSAFPTYQEQVLWRTSAITVMCLPCLIFAVGFVLFRSRIE